MNNKILLNNSFSLSLSYLLLISIILCSACGKGSKYRSSEDSYVVVEMVEDTVEETESNVQDLDSQKSHMAVDLGLPSGIKWATMNVGANEYYECGEYYSIGDITPYDMSKRKRENPLASIPLKTSVKVKGNPDYDTATANWGMNWSLPSSEDFYELQTNCKWIWTNEGGVNGYIVEGPNGNSIFLPAAGYKEKVTGEDYMEIKLKNLDGRYWVAPYADICWYSEVDKRRARYSCFCFAQGGSKSFGDETTASGLSIRPVTYASFEELGLDEDFVADMSKVPEKAAPTVSGTIDQHEYVDLGLPSGTKWSTKNIGARNLYENGLSFQWGSKVAGDYYGSSDGSTLGNADFVQNIAGNFRYDAAMSNWGDSWQLPSVDDFQEILDHCVWVTDIKDGNPYYIVTGPNKNTMIIPMGNFGLWSSQPESAINAYCFVTDYDTRYKHMRSAIIGYVEQIKEMSIRPVSK